MPKLDKSILIQKGKVNIEGLDGLIQTFRDLTGNKADAKLAGAMKYALKPLHEKVKALAPKKKNKNRKNLVATSGMLRKSISIKSKKFGKGKGKKVVGLVGPKIQQYTTVSGRTVKPYLYAHLVERGAKPHTIAPRKKERQKSFVGPIMPHRFKSWKHPGAKQKPFMQPALQAVGSEIFARFSEKMSEIIANFGKPKGTK